MKITKFLATNKLSIGLFSPIESYQGAIPFRPLTHTDKIALASGSIVLPLRHPIHTAKSAASINELSHDRLILGVASGEEPSDYAAFGRNRRDRADLFRENFEYVRKLMSQAFPQVAANSYGELNPISATQVFVSDRFIFKNLL